MAARKAEASDLVTLLEGALAGTDAALWQWYRALADQCPLWARQQAVYTELFGPQTVEGRGVTEWRVMSHCVEQDEPLPSELAWHRLALEFIGRIESPEGMTHEALATLAGGQFADNVTAEMLPTVAQAVQFFQNRPTRSALPAARRQVTGRPAHRGLQSVLPRAAVARIVREAAPWLTGVRLQRARLDSNSRIALPFVDSVEFDYMLKDAGNDLREVAAILVTRRLTAFSGGHVSPRSVYKYAFHANPKRTLHALKPDSPKYQTQF